MFDVGFLEILVIGVIALLVFGPERLPSVARNVGLWVGRARQMFNQFKSEVERTANVQEIQELTNQNSLKEAYEILEETHQSFKTTVSQAQDTVSAPFNASASNTQSSDTSASSTTTHPASSESAPSTATDTTNTSDPSSTTTTKP